MSYTHSGFDRCCAALIAFAVELADVAEARVFDATQQLTRELADELVDPESAYMAREFQRRIEILEQMENAGGAPLEYPLGLHDWVDDYFRFHVPVGSLRGSRARMTERLEASLRAQDDAWFRTVSDGAYLLGRTGDDAGLTRVLLADDGYVQVWPRYGMVPFSVPAGLTLSVARRVADAVGHGQLEFYGRNVDDALLSELTTRAKGHGLDLYLWMIDTWPSSSNP
ncbi:MAG: hypothetical protein JXP73_09065 [Deltaproteobacteria bacterium]|nr:hypothetical protein [Deltaproteobacteria bacterium]